MTTRIDAPKTNEFLRRRKLRLQQVREQSKEIARKIRQRAKVENLRNLETIDAKKEKEYFECQEKFVKHLEHLYCKRLQNVGASHKNAVEANHQDFVQKIDISKLRGKEAVAELRKKKQEKLDEQKKLLDRKLQARDAANEISRDKSVTVAKSLTKPSSKKSEDLQTPVNVSDTPNKGDNNQHQDGRQENLDITKNDMGTQCETEEIPNDWEPNVPVLSLPKEDSVKDSGYGNIEKLDKSKRLNLFALSDEMPSSLRGGLTGITDTALPIKPTMTLVSEYLQNRNLRLREAEPSRGKSTDDLQSIKQTILRTRATRTDGSKEKTPQSTELYTGLNRKKSITVYNHNTRNVQDMPCDDEQFVTRDNKSEEDAYVQALKETTIGNHLEKEQLDTKQKDIRTKVAMTKKNVEKEYKDTLAFLNSLTREKKGKPIKKAYMDDHQRQMHYEKHQRRLQHEFKEIEKECYKQNCKHSKRKATIFENNSKSKSPAQSEQIQRDFEYSWMPVPEMDGSLAIHTIPNTKNKSGNTVKFSQAESYHEYRSRHKHTPPTKDVCNDRQRVVETVILQETSNDSDINESSSTSEASSLGNLNLENDRNKTSDETRLKDAERIIIYKILESKKDKNKKNHKKTKDNKSEISVKNKEKKSVIEAKDEKTTTRKLEKSAGDIQTAVSFEQLQEGVYEAISSNGDNIGSTCFTELPQENLSRQCDKIESCRCSKNKDMQNDGGDIEARLLKQASSCKCRQNNGNTHLNQPSAVTSTTSFTTAFNDKINNRQPAGDFIRLIDDGGQESSKFYIGASGFLKDNNYEVVIQLRKKEDEKVNNTNETKQPNTKPVEVLDLEIQKIEQTVSSDIAFNSKENNFSAVTTKNNVHTLNKEQSEIEIISVENEKLHSQFNNTCEKPVQTFQDPFAIPAHVPKSDPLSRPATSIYTQTSFNSSIPRPVFMHMSSSTSTAYMSPPEVILPKFLKHNRTMTKEEIYESENTINQLDSNFEVIEDENCKKVNGCRCRVNEKYQLKTPPNTARCSGKEQPDDVKIKKIKCKCDKCRSRSETNICHKGHRKKSSNILKTRSARDLPSDNLNPTIKKSKQIKIVHTHPNNKAASSNKLNPVVKSYVNKLLALNSEGLKAIEIINQDCSAVTTPGSSIINLPCNRKNEKIILENKISLEQIKNILKQQILKDKIIREGSTTVVNNQWNESQIDKNSKVPISKIPQNNLKLAKKKSVHKVKSLNISKHILKKKKPYDSYISTHRLKKSFTSVSSSVGEKNKLSHANKQATNSRNKNSTTTRSDNSEYKNSTSSDITETANNKLGKNIKVNINNTPVKSTKYIVKTRSGQNKNFNLPLHRGTCFSSDSDATGAILKHLQPPQPPIHISTQTNEIIDAEINFMKVAEDKLQNMEKIADLTEKCTKRLSNLAKVLEEVRRNKSLAYSQISTSDSTPEPATNADKNEVSTEFSGSHTSDPNILIQNKETNQNFASLSNSDKLDNKYLAAKESTEFTPFLKDIPKPELFTTPLNASDCNLIDIPNKPTKAGAECDTIKSRGRPPPALSRVYLKSAQDVIPHELSTVIEVDSPMSLKLKNQTSRQDTKLEILEKSERLSDGNDKRSKKAEKPSVTEENIVDPDVLSSDINLSRRLSKLSSTDSSDDSKMRMMDMKKFNNIMLRPFISLKEFAKECNIGLDEDSNPDDLNKNEPINDDLSSLHSDGSLPDVIAELLKRNIISEPFKFDTGSNVNSTTVSSESTLSVLALSKARKGKKSGLFLKNKENIAETSETLSMSSNPDLENAFQKLGMGWASSTLKKTKERLALSSSSNTSSSSMTQFKMKSFGQDIPNLEIDSTLSLLEDSSKRERKKSSPGRYNVEEISRNAVQQTSLTNSMTVREFLVNELAKKITFNNKSSRKEAEEFVSLHETKMPEEMKRTVGREDQLSVASVNGNRARTSTPVQIFKSQAYQSSSTSNTSNGFFSNADDLSSVKLTSTSIRNHSTSDKDDLTIPNYSLKTKKGLSDCSKSD